MKRIAVINLKGGSGKTTLAALLVKSLPGSLAVDLDPQAGLSSLLCGEGNRPSSGPGVFDLIMGDEVKPLYVKDFSILPADHRLDAIYGTVQPFMIESILKDLDYPYIIMDCPPTVQGITRSAALFADIILTPADISRPTMRATLYTVKALKEIKKRARVYLIGKDPEDRTGYTAELTRIFIDELGASFYGFIPKSIALVKAAGKLDFHSRSLNFIKGMI